MRKIFLSALVLLSLNLHAQDMKELWRIDSLTGAIDRADFHVKHDTIRNDQPDVGLFMITYLTMVTDGHELKKYVNNVHITKNEKGTTREMFGTSVFYFDRGNLIKVEDSAIDRDKKFEARWYYENNKILYYTPQTESSADRAEKLIRIGAALMAQFSR